MGDDARRLNGEKGDDQSWSAAAKSVFSRQAFPLSLCFGLISVPAFFLVRGHSTYTVFLVVSYMWLVPLFVAALRISYDRSTASGHVKSLSFTIKELLILVVLSAPFYTVAALVSHRMAAVTPVLFITDRPEIAINFRGYTLPCDDGIENCSSFAFGEALVLVPLAERARPPGDTEVTAYNSDEPKLIPLKRADFYSELRWRASRSPEKDAFLYTHGFRTSFGEALRDTAQMSVDLKFKGAAIAFSWPSEHEGILSLLTNYGGDSRRVPIGANDLAVILPLVRDRSKAARFDIIAHSIGSNLTAQAILQAKTQLCEKEATFTNIVLSAPDILPELFAQQAPALLCSAKRLTIYYSSHDKPLLASTLLQQGRRIGRGVPPISGADMIDAGEVDPTFLGHSHLFSWPELNDVCTLMHSDVKAGDRFGVFQDADTGGFVLSEVKR